MTTLKQTIAAGASALALTAGAASAQEVTFTLIPRVEEGSNAQLDLERWMDFESAVTLSVQIDPALVPSARVIEMVESIGMVDGFGVRIERGYAIDVVHDLVVAFSGGSAEIASIRQTDQGLIVAALFRDEQGRIVKPAQGSLAAYTINGERLCFAPDEEQVELSVPGSVSEPGSAAQNPMAFSVLLDRSGSMSGVRSKVDRAARSFIDALPNDAQCTVGGFASTFSFNASDGYGTASCRADNFSLSGGRDLGGSTDLFTPLAEVYERMNAPEISDHQRAVIIITDGGLNQSLELEAELLRAQGQTVTFVYFLGGESDEHLQALAHNYLDHEGDLAASLDRYFDVVSMAYSSQSLLRLVPCPDELDEG